MKRYYFLVNLLPRITIKEPPSMSIEELKRLCDLNLIDSDRMRMQEFFMYVDVFNLKALWSHKNIDDRGNLDKNKLLESIAIEEFFPQFVYDYIHKYKTDINKKINFSVLLTQFFNYSIERNRDNFISFFFDMERCLRLILSALRCKSLGIDFLQEFKFDDTEDFLVKYIISQNENKDFQPPPEFLELKKSYMNNKDNPKKLNYFISKYRFNKIEEKKKNYYFTIDHILAYFAQILIVQDLFIVEDAEIIKWLDKG